MAEKRKGKRSRQFLGTRNHGKGNAKNRRGKGSKGGWGRAGMHKHRFTYATVYEKEWVRFGGRHGFSSPNRKDVAIINLFEIESNAQKGKLAKKDGMLTFEFDGKILGSGELSQPVVVTARGASQKAVERIQKAGGKFILVGAKEDKAVQEKKN